MQRIKIKEGDLVESAIGLEELKRLYRVIKIAKDSGMAYLRDEERSYTITTGLQELYTRV